MESIRDESGTRTVVESLGFEHEVVGFWQPQDRQDDRDIRRDSEFLGG